MASSKTITTSETAKATGKALIDFINKSPSPFHAVYETVEQLKQNGFIHLKEDKPWGQLKQGGKYYVTRNQSAVVAFAVGGKYVEGNGFHIVGAHTDSPCLRVKPISKLESSGCLQIGVECYGGGLWNTWFDRDLGVAGRVFVRENANSVQSRLVLLNKPILRIPTLAIHLDSEVRKGFAFNNETQLRPILATTALSELSGCGPVGDKPHHPLLLQAIAKELNIEVDQICDFELSLFDTQGGSIGGILEEFVFAPRLDNLCCSWVSTQSLIRSLPTLTTETNVRMIGLFDNEEVGSNSLMGAGSNFLQQIMTRIAQGDKFGGEAARKSMLISADMAHAIHPNYPEKHETNSKMQFQGGPVIKYNANERYATSGETAFLMKELGRKHGIDIQEFVSRQDCGCGSTIGPILATNTGIRTIDIGLPQLSMHSIREMCGVQDLVKAINWFEIYFNEFSALDKCVHTD